MSAPSGDIVRHGHTLTLNCERCRHRSELDLLALIAANGEDYLVRKLVDRAVCSKCGDRDAEVSCTLGVAHSPRFSYPDYGGSKP
jgi:hypothetical protein